MKSHHIFKCICFVFFFSLLQACTNTNSFENIQPPLNSTQNIQLPLSDSKPTVLVLCNNSDVSCHDLWYITSHLDEMFGEDTVSVGYVFINSSHGARIFDNLRLSDIPSYVIFNANKEEIFRGVGTIDLNQLDENISILISN